MEQGAGNELYERFPVVILASCVLLIAAVFFSTFLIHVPARDSLSTFSNQSDHNDNDNT